MEEKNEDARVKVDDDEIMYVVAKWTGIPLKRMGQGDVQKLLSMEKEISKIVSASPWLSRRSARRCAAAAPTSRIPHVRSVPS
ncbi:MAG: hypothetical protein Ct9H300mP32_2550 [Verrucomicrobiota bacterium]|nr:MAG: hypothetical protein Ct9H300mP32_2550 [Verrucomicrobiota bacterium]